MIGLGKTGLASVFALLHGKAKVIVWDDAFQQFATTPDAAHDIVTLFCKAALLKGDLVINPTDAVAINKLTKLLVSPGIPKDHHILQQAVAYGIPITSDIEMLQDTCIHAKYIAVTGTNGKSTTTALIGEILRVMDLPVEVGGNIGTPALALSPLEQSGIYVLELSSFQLDLLTRNKFNVAVLLNITPDHLDRHGDFAAYRTAKTKIFEHQTAADYAIISVDCPEACAIYNALLASGPQRVLPISTSKLLSGGVSVIDNVLYDNINISSPKTFDLGVLERLPGKHNAENIAAAYTAVRCVSLNIEMIIEGIKAFQGLPHRMEPVLKIGGLRFINDSKATNADAAKNGFTLYDNIYWIAGGISKEEGIEPLQPFFHKLKHVFLIGESTDRFAETLEQYHIPHTKAGHLQGALELIKQGSIDDGIVLFSPACASFDQWKNYEHRGDAFKKMVKEIWEHTD